MTFVVACGDDDTPAPSTDNDEVIVENPGAEPQETLRYSFAEGTEVRSVMTMRLGLEMAVDGQPLPTTELPATRVVITVRIDSVDGNEAEASFAYDELEAVPEPGIDPAVVETMNAALADVQGVTGTMTINDRGETSAAEIDSSTVSDPNIRATLDSVTSQISALTVAFPAEPVGVGAVWSANQQAELNGIRIETTTTYTLRARNGADYEFDVQQDVTAPPGPAEIPGLGAADVEIVSYDTANTGTVAGSLSSPLPTESDLTGGGDITMRITEGGETSNLTQQLTIEITLAPA